MLKVTKHNLTLIVPDYWIDSGGFLKVPALYALKLFYGEVTLEKALESAEKKWKYGWTIKEVEDNENENESEGR